MSTVTCECGETFESPREAVAHAKANLHRVNGLYFSHRKEVEEHFHSCGICTHVSRSLDGCVSVCIASNPVAPRVPA